MTQINGPVLLTRDQVLTQIGMTKSYLYQLIRQGRFPEPIKITPGKVGGVRWRRDEVETWLASRDRSGITNSQETPWHKSQAAAQAQA